VEGLTSPELIKDRVENCTKGYRNPSIDKHYQTNIFLGYICPAGTNKGNETQIKCPQGFFCYNGTASEADARKNKCPKGRTCKEGTSAENSTEYDDCIKDELVDTITACQIGGLCSQGFFCPEGTGEKGESCPPGRDSEPGAFHISHCKRTEEKFDQSELYSNDPIIPISDVFIFKDKFHYIEFNTSVNIFLSKKERYNPEDYQLNVGIQKFETSPSAVTKQYLVPFIKPDSFGSRTQIPTFLTHRDYYLKSPVKIIMVHV
jgi:hypothetical protein